MLVKGLVVNSSVAKNSFSSEIAQLEAVYTEIKKHVAFNEQLLTELKAVEFFAVDETSKNKEVSQLEIKDADVQGQALILKHGDNIFIEITKYKKMETLDTDVYIDVTIVSDEEDGTYKRKITFENGKLISNFKINTQYKDVEFLADTFLSNEEVSSTSSDPDEFWGVPCFDIKPASAECCQFRYNGLPWNPLVTYRYCGAGCTSKLTPVNPLDACCKTHDSCYGKVYNSCACDRTFITCASKTDEAGSSRVVAAFRLKVSTGFCK